MSIPMKTIRDIKTSSGRSDRVATAYMTYMQITCLEMEKARKWRERLSAMQRLHLLDTRLQQIDVEKGSLLEELARREAATDSGGCPSRSPSRRRGLSIRY